MLKKLAVLIAALALSAPALADRGHRNGHHYGHSYGYHHGHHYGNRFHQPHYVAHRPAVVHHYYRPAPRPVVVVRRHDPLVPLLVGAVIGAAIVHHAATGY